MSYFIILAGGKGSRFHPITKYYPKEMLPLGRFPAFHYILRESDIPEATNIIILYRYFGDMLKEYAKNEFPHLFEKIEFIQQPDTEIYGTGASLFKLKNILQNEKFFSISFSDDVIFGENCFVGMYELLRKKDFSGCIATSKVKQDEVPQFGNLKISPNGLITKIIQKPTINKAFSNNALVSKLILSPDIFYFLNNSYYKDELDLGVALSKMCEIKRIASYSVTHKWATTGDPYNYAKGVNLWYKNSMKKF